MKKVLLFFVLILGAETGKAQLANTSWTGIANIPTEASIILQFKTDTVNMLLADNNFLAETMTYTVKGNVITLKKVSGGSPCNNAPFTVTYTLSNDQMTIKTLADDCYERKNAWTDKPFTKLKTP